MMAPLQFSKSGNPITTLHIGCKIYLKISNFLAIEWKGYHNQLIKGFFVHVQRPINIPKIESCKNMHIMHVSSERECITCVNNLHFSPTYIILEIKPCGLGSRIRDVCSPKSDQKYQGPPIVVRYMFVWNCSSS